MPTPINWARWDAIQAELNQCLRDGFAPPNVPGGKGSAVLEAERRLAAAGIISFGENTRSLLAKWLSNQERRAKRGLEHRLPDWSLFRQLPRQSQPSGSAVRARWLLTAAQNDTPVFEPFWQNLMAYSRYLGAEILVGGFTYQLGLFSDHSTRANVFAEAVRPYMRFERTECGPVLFCAEMNTLPTAERPLSGLHTYGRGRTAVFPHAKRALESVAAMPGNAPPVVLTTGCVTVENYVPKKAGLKAEFHHAFGAVIVELDAAGDAHFRHLAACRDGSFQDLDLLVRDGRVLPGQRVEAITFGDIQSPFVDPGVAMATWGFDADESVWTCTGSGMVDVLRPRVAVLHDLCDFRSISHHEAKAAGERYRTFTKGGHSLNRDLSLTARFVRAIDRDFMRLIIAPSNHDRWLDRWLDRCDHRADRVNALTFLRLDTARHEAIASGDSDFNIFRHALRQAVPGALDNAEFIPLGASYTVCREFGGGIELAAHGDLGVNGTRATPRGLAQVVSKLNIGDKHTPSIVDGVYVAGTSSLLQLGYNHGPSSWAHAHTVVYPSGHRSIIFITNGKWRAG